MACQSGESKNKSVMMVSTRALQARGGGWIAYWERHGIVCEGSSILDTTPESGRIMQSLRLFVEIICGGTVGPEVVA